MTKFNWSWLSIILLALSITTFTACDDDDILTPDEGFIEYLDANQEYSLFRDALDEADLIDNIRLFPREVTFFVPNNTAMTAFLQSNGYSDLEAVPDDLLEATLRSHILEFAVRAAEFQTAYYATNNDVRDDDIRVAMYINTNSGVVINGDVTVIDPDQLTKDGVVHEVDRVISPASVATFATADQNLSTLLSALQRVDNDGSLVQMLSALDEGPFTLLAPTNAAFQNLLNSNPDWNSLEDIDETTLRSVLLYHLIAGDRLLSSEITNNDPILTESGGTVEFERIGTNLRVIAGGNTANVLLADVIAENGVIYAIDTVILPQ